MSSSHVSPGASMEGLDALRDRNAAVGARIDAAPIGMHQIKTAFLCVLLAFIDGFDMAGMGLATPLIAAEWGVEAGTLGVALSASLAGLGLGALVFGPLGDRFGRKPLLLLAGVLIAIGSFGSAFASGNDAMIFWRLLVGVGFGASLPNMFALTSDVMPSRRRVLAVTLLALGMALGNISAGMLSPALVQMGGWPAIFAFGGIIPIILTVVMIFGLQESPRLLARSARGSAKLASVLRSMRISSEGLPETVISAKTETSSPLEILQGRNLPITLIIALIWINTGFTFYFISGWLPSLLVAAGWEVEEAMRGLTLLYTGGMVGGFATSWVMDRSRSPALAAAVIAGVAIALFLVTSTQISGPLAQVMLVLLGLFAAGGLHILPGLISGFYPSRNLGTALGWISAASRVGSVAGPLVGGWLMLNGWSPHQVIAFLAVPQTISTLGLLALFAIDSRSSPKPADKLAPASAL